MSSKEFKMLQSSIQVNIHNILVNILFNSRLSYHALTTMYLIKMFNWCDCNLSTLGFGNENELHI